MRSHHKRYRLELEQLEPRELLAAPIVVHVGESIQAAIDAAPAGAIIRIDQGTFAEALTINTPDLTILGAGQSKTILTNPGGANNGITVNDGGDGIEHGRLTVSNFARNGVFLRAADNYTIAHVTVENNGRYGLFPVRSNNGVIEHCTATGHSDTGIYVGSLDGVTLHHNRVSGNVNGFAIENSSHVVATHNVAQDNVVGMLVILLPGLSVQESSNILIAHNDVSDNNHVNFGAPGSLESFLPSGSGILVVGTDNTTIEKNHIDGNNFVGIGVVSTYLVGAIADIPPDDFIGADYNPDRVLVLKNHLNGNGISSVIPGIPPADLIWDGSGMENQWDHNHFDTSIPSALS